MKQGDILKFVSAFFVDAIEIIWVWNNIGPHWLSMNPHPNENQNKKYGVLFNISFACNGLKYLVKCMLMLLN